MTHRQVDAFQQGDEFTFDPFGRSKQGPSIDDEDLIPGTAADTQRGLASLLGFRWPIQFRGPQTAGPRLTTYTLNPLAIQKVTHRHSFVQTWMGLSHR